MSQRARDPLADLERRTDELETALDALTFEVADLNHRVKALAAQTGDDTDDARRRAEVGVGLDEPEREPDDADDGIYVA